MLAGGFLPEEESGIFFFTEDLPKIPDLPGTTTDWIRKIVANHDRNLHRINYIFCSDPYLLNINQEYLDHDAFTDIITFPYSSDPIESDVFISLDRVKENAADRGLPYPTELARVMIHGVLHLLGYGDKTDEGKAEMRRMEDECLSLLEIE